MSIEPGRYKAKIQDYGIKTVGEKNTPQLNVSFKTFCDQTIFFKNFLTPGTTGSEYFSSLMDTLTSTGALTTKRFTDIAKGLEGGAFNTDVELEVVVDVDLDQNGQPRLDKSGKAFMKVAFINDPKRAGLKGVLAEAEAITILGGLNLDAHILQSRARVGATDVPGVNESDVPF